MASPSGASSGSSSYQEEVEKQDIMEQKKSKRLLSNRESARRSRIRKQQHVEDLIGELGELRKQNSQMITSLGITTQLYLNVEAENANLRTQMAALSNRLHSFNKIIDLSSYLFQEVEEITTQLDPWNQPMMASTNNMLMYSCE